MSRRAASPTPSPSIKRIKEHHDDDVTLALPFALHAAAKSGNEERVRKIIERKKTDDGFEVDVTDPDGLTAFAYACLARHAGIMRLLLEAGSDVQQTFDGPDATTTCAALTALLPPDTAMMGMLLDLGLSADETFPFTTPPDLSLLGLAVEYLSIEMVTLLLAHGADVDAIDGSGKAALHTAVKIQLVELVEALLATGADPDLEDADGDTPLRLAASLKNLDIAAMLVEAGADVDLRGLDGNTPVMSAGDEQCAEMVLLLLQLGANPDAQSDMEWSPLHEACRRLNYEIAEMLLEAGADVDCRMRWNADEDGTPLTFTVAEAEDEDHEALMRIISLLNDFGADLNDRDSLGRTALRHALHRPIDVIELLLLKGADPNLADKVGDTPLHAAVADESPDVVDLLREYGADAHEANDEGDSPFSLALLRLEVGFEDEAKAVMAALLTPRWSADELPPYARN